MADEQNEIANFIEIPTTYVMIKVERLFLERGNRLLILRPLTIGAITIVEVSLYQGAANAWVLIRREIFVIPSLPAIGFTSGNSLLNLLRFDFIPKRRERQYYCKRSI